jgi:hypothetical protein
MAISPSLQQFKSSGVYRLEFDKSQITNIPSETIRLIIGFSKKGPFNTPVFVQDNVFFKAVFGDIDPVLERKGSFFHRTALTCLTRGPVIVLNLLNLDDDQDTSQYVSVSTSATEINSPVDSAPVSKYFNTDKFWFVDPNELLNVANLGAYQSAFATRLINFANVGRKPVSVITRRSDLLGYDVLAKEWFSAGAVPFFMNENDYISDYLIDVIILEGDFTNYTNLSIDPIFGNYFNTTGLKKTIIDEYGFERDGLNTFLALPQVNVLGVYSGSIIPDFQDQNNNNIFVQDLVNLETSKTGVLMAINRDAFDNDTYQMGGVAGRVISADIVDLVGHTVESEQPGIINFLSYYGSIIQDLNYANKSGNPSIYATSIVGSPVAGTTANALLQASTSLQGVAGYTTVGATGYFDKIIIYGPSATRPATFTSAFATKADLTTFADSISAGNSFIKVDLKRTSGPTGSVNFAAVTSKDYDSTAETLTLQTQLILDPSSTYSNFITGPTNADYAFFHISAPGVSANGGTSTIGIIKNNDWIFQEGGLVYGGPNSGVNTAFLDGIISDGDRISINGLTGSSGVYKYIDFTNSITNDFSGSTFNGSTKAFPSGLAPIFNKNLSYTFISAYDTADFIGFTAISATASFPIKTLTDNINESLEVDSSITPNNPTNVVYFDNSAAGPLGLAGFLSSTEKKIIKGDYLVQNFGGTDAPNYLDTSKTGKSRLTKVTSVIEFTDPLSPYYQKIKVTTNDPIYIDPVDGTVERYKDIRSFFSYYRPVALNGYSLRDAQMPNGSVTRQNQILDVMYNSNLANALTDRELITFRYIIDSFEGTIEPGTKVRLSRLAKNRQSALAICNMPSVKQFKNSSNPIFKFTPTSSFDAKYIATGGNLDLAPSNIFSLPGIADGSNFAAYYGPNLIIRENGANVSVPPAAHVSNLYIDKYNLALPYSIVAGPRRGVVTGTGLVGVEFAFDRNDLDSIEPFGYNAILNKRGFGLVINANQTAQQNVKSALSQIHVRELVIYIQDGIEAILKNYRWEFNNAQNRLEIKTLADNFLSQILTDGGLYDYQNIMDTTNNTNEIIDSNIGILDTYIEPARGMGILVHRTTILRTGTIATGNFL